MFTVDLDDKLWGWKAKYHFYAFTAVFVAVSLISTIAVIDYAKMPKAKVTADFRKVFWHEYMYAIPMRMTMGVAFLSLISCPNHIWYAFCSVTLLVWAVTSVTFGTLRLIYHGSWYGTDEGDWLDARKYFPCGMASDMIFGMTSRALMFYLGVVLFKLSFLYTPKPEEDDSLIIITTPPPTIITIDENGNPKVSQTSPIAPSPSKPLLKSPEAKESSESERGPDCMNRSPTGRMTAHLAAKRSERSAKKSRRSQRSASENLEAEKSGKSSSTSSKGSQKSQKSKKSQKSQKSQKSEKTNSNSLEEKPVVVGL